jgi:hypothetical protein
MHGHDSSPPTFVLPKNSETSRTMNGLSHKHLAALKGSFWGQRLPVKAKLEVSCIISSLLHDYPFEWVTLGVQEICVVNLGFWRFGCFWWSLKREVFLHLQFWRFGYLSHFIIGVGLGILVIFIIDWSFLSNVYFVLLLEGLVQGFVCLFVYF